MDSAPRSPADTLSPTEFASVVTAITSAFGDPTRRDIYLHVHENPDGVTAVETARHFELHPNVARHHLDKLAGGGYVSVSSGRSGTGAGRPSKRYTRTHSAMPIDLPVRHHDVVVTLLGRALSLLPPGVAEAMAEEVGVEYGKTMARSFGEASETQRSVRSALHSVADALTANGFAAHAEKRGNDLYIVAEHCPFGGAAIEHPVICAVDRGMVQGMLSEIYGESSAAHPSSLPQGDARCITTIDS